jgi:hypothetical protein
MSIASSSQLGLSAVILSSLGILSLRDLALFNHRLRTSLSPLESMPNVLVGSRIERIDYVIGALEASRDKVASVVHSETVDWYFSYDLSGKQALIDLYRYIKDNDIKLPLFDDRLTPALEGSRIEPVPKVCAIVITHSRHQSWFSYLVQTVSGLLNRMNYSKYKDSFYVYVVNVDHNPEAHPELNLIRDLVPVTNVLYKVTGSFEIPYKLQENSDYSRMIRMFDKIGCEYPIMVEDDALAQVNWADEVMLGIKEIEEKYSKKDKQWFATKLFNKRDSFSKTGINEWPHVYYTVAMMYNAATWLVLADELDAVINKSLKQGWFDYTEAKDYIVDRAARTASGWMLSYDPVIFQHTGLASTLENRDMSDYGATELKKNPRYSKFFPSDGIPIVFNVTHWVDSSEISFLDELKDTVDDIV